MTQNEKRARKKARISQYKNSFMKGNDRTAREGKSVYIIPEFHERLQRIVHVIGGNKLTIFNYLHNILEQHFNEYGEDIKAIFNEKQKPIL